jgi:ADP-heptose:LPS heptosyltransferase
VPQTWRPGGIGAGWLRGVPRPGGAEVEAFLATEAPRILVVKTHDQLGDFLVATPALEALRARFPAARIELVTRDYLAPLAHRQRSLDAVHVLPRVRGPREAGDLVALVSRLRAPVPDLAIVLNSVSRSRTADRLATLAGARLIVGRSRVGPGAVDPDAPDDPYTPAREPLAAGRHRDPVYDLDLAVGRASAHQVDRLLDLVRWTGASAGPEPRMTLATTPEERARGREALDGKAPRVGIHPAAANALKCWSGASFVDLGARLAANGAAISVFDTPKEPGPARAVHGGLVSRSVAAGLVPAGSLDSFIEAASALDLMICNDSGVMHIAAALGVPTLSFHSLGRPEEWAPRGPRAIALHAEPIAGIAVGDAFQAAERLLSSRG